MVRQFATPHLEAIHCPPLENATTLALLVACPFLSVIAFSSQPRTTLDPSEAAVLGFVNRSVFNAPSNCIAKLPNYKSLKWACSNERVAAAIASVQASRAGLFGKYTEDQAAEAFLGLRTVPLYASAGTVKYL
jgi:hypothetical protein